MMRGFFIVAVCFLVVLQVSMSSQSPRRRVRQADDNSGMNFPDEDSPDTENRWGQSNGGRRPNRPQIQPNRPNRPNRPDRPNRPNRPDNNNGNNNGGRPDQQQQASTSSSTAASVTTPAAPSPDCVRRCPVTPEYNPVCGSSGGTNRQGFTNRSRLDCARNCGQGIQFLRMGNC